MLDDLRIRSPPAQGPPRASAAAAEGTPVGLDRLKVGRRGREGSTVHEPPSSEGSPCTTAMCSGQNTARRTWNHADVAALLIEREALPTMASSATPSVVDPSDQ